MLKRLLFNSIVLLLCLGNFLTAQNLVPNYSFENYSGCPTAGGQVSKAIGWENDDNLGTSDYFNICSTDPVFSIPNQDGYNYQTAKSGFAFIGLATLNIYGGNQREYIRTQLIDTLSLNECYYVEFYTNLSSTQFGGTYSTNNIALAFTSTDIVNQELGGVLNIVSHIKKFGNPIIIDTMNWVRIAGLYNANGDENYITIGNFNFDNETDTLNVGNPGDYPAAYYFIDDVSVIAVSDLPNSMPAYAGEDQYIEIGDSVFIGQEISNLNCTWSILGGAQIADSISGIYVQPTVTTTYVVEQNLCSTITYDTVTVFVHGVGLSELERAGSVSVFPNPNRGLFELDLSKIDAPAQQLVILDASGRLVYEVNIITISKITIETSLEKGIYSLRLVTDLGVFEEKVVIY